MVAKTAKLCLYINDQVKTVWH